MASNNDHLVDERFERRLSSNERALLEARLVASPEAAERYRRRHLLERVASIGPERALEEPSPMEIDRIAADLGLFAPDEAPAWWRRLLSVRILGPAMIAVTAMVVLLVSVPRSELQERGAPATRSAVAFVVSFEGVRPLGDVASTSEHLKFRVTNEGAAPSALSAVVVDAAGGTVVVRLEVPPPGTSTVPGAVPLATAAPGAATVWLVAAPPGAFDPAALPNDEVVARFDVRIEGASTK